MEETTIAIIINISFLIVAYLWGVISSPLPIFNDEGHNKSHS